MGTGPAIGDVGGRITTVSFDGDGTLWDFDRVMRHSLRKVLAILRGLLPAAADSLTVDTMIAIRDEVAEEQKGKGTTLEDVRRSTFRKTLEHIGHPDDALADRLNALYFRHRFEGIELFDDVRPTLAALRGRYRLGLLSNGNTYPERIGLEAAFDFVVFAQEHGVEKPDPRIFSIAMERAGCGEHELLHVGDSLEEDVAGAKERGAWSAWLNRQRKSNDTGIEPDFELSSLLELEDLCKRRP
jgi:HAD superfamily hydrolase (TIGR01549 family)